VPFVDLFAPTQKLVTESQPNPTIDGIHLNEKRRQADRRDSDTAPFGPRPQARLTSTLLPVNENPPSTITGL
jgi:hypothetical protein